MTKNFITINDTEVERRIDQFRDQFKVKTGRNLSRPNAIKAMFCNDTTFNMLMSADVERRRKKRNEFIFKI